MNILSKQAVIDLTKPSSGGGGGGTDSYSDLTNKPKINSVTLSGNKTSAQLGLVGDVQFNGTSVVTNGVGNITSANIRSVAPVCTTLSGTTATITANSTYAHAVGSSGCVYTISTPADTSTVYNGFILMLDTTNSASIAFQTDATPAVSIQISGNPTIETGKKYTVTGQFSPLSNAWELFIISYEV